jgi:hypothetical protein
MDWFAKRNDSKEKRINEWINKSTRKINSEKVSNRAGNDLISNLTTIKKNRLMKWKIKNGKKHEVVIRNNNSNCLKKHYFQFCQIYFLFCFDAELRFFSFLKTQLIFFFFFNQKNQAYEIRVWLLIKIFIPRIKYLVLWVLIKFSRDPGIFDLFFFLCFFLFRPADVKWTIKNKWIRYRPLAFSI